LKLDADIIIVGSGIGGATIAKELAKRKKKILILERGSFYHPNQIGSELCAYKFYDRHGLWSKTKEGIFYYRALMVGGTSVVSCGNGTRSLEKEFKKLGMDLTKEFIEVEKELNIKPISGRLIGKGTKKIMQAADKLGFKMEPMPKYINIRKCDACGNCVLGCQSEAKWTALQYLTQAQENGVSLLTGINVTKVLVSKRRAIGLQGFNQAGKRIEKFANIIVLAAGGIGTPIILQNSKIKAGDKLFLDLFNVTIGLTKDKGLTKEPVMAAVHHNRGFVLSPFIDTPLVLASVVPLSLRRNIKISTQRDHLLGIMVKIKDDCRGRVNKDGSIEKTITPKDLFKFFCF